MTTIQSLPRLVALDTETFNSKSFNYKNKVLQKILNLSKEGKIEIFLTSITYEEVSNQISRSIEELVEKFRSTHKEIAKHRFAKNSLHTENFLQNLESLEGIFDLINKDLTGQLECFIKDSNASILPIENVSPVAVFDKYFSKSPPFKHGKKKSEFPDAFSLMALEAKAKSEDRILYVVSSDDAWKRFCQDNEFLTHFSRVEEFFEYILSKDHKDDTKICYEFLEEKLGCIVKAIKEQFAELDFSLEDSEENSWEIAYLSDIDIEVNVESIQINNKLIVDVDDLNPRELFVFFDMEAEIGFSSNVSYIGIDYRHNPKHHMHEAIEVERKVNTYQKISFPVEATIELAREKDHSLHFKDIDCIDLKAGGWCESIKIYPPEHYSGSHSDEG